VRRLRDVDDFPIMTRVITPTGRLGIVVAHKGASSRLDAHDRCVIRYADGGGRDRESVELLPHLLVRADGKPHEGIPQ